MGPAYRGLEKLARDFFVARKKKPPHSKLPASFKGQKLAHKKKVSCQLRTAFGIAGALFGCWRSIWLCWRFILVAQNTIQRDSHFQPASFFLLIISPVARKFSCTPKLAFKLVFFAR
jgi:hypothetical protein